MKKIIILLIILMLTSIVSAETLNKGDSMDVGRKTLIIVNIGDDNAIISVDGIKNIVHLNEEKEINGVGVKVTEIFFFDENEGYVNIEISGGGTISQEPVCGDENCEGEEDKNNCCKDCGCEYGYGCINEKCIKAECMEHKECYGTPKDYCSLDKCDPIMKKCIHIPITECIINDKCCPTRCYAPEDSDCNPSIKNPNPTETKKGEIKKDISKEGITNNTTEEKIGFFSKIINWFKELFN